MQIFHMIRTPTNVLNAHKTNISILRKVNAPVFSISINMVINVFDAKVVIKGTTAIQPNPLSLIMAEITISISETVDQMATIGASNRYTTK